MSPGPARPPDDPSAREREQLATFLAILLTLVFGGGFLLFLVVISFNLFLGVIGVALATAVFAGVHYLIWGRRQASDDEPRD